MTCLKAFFFTLLVVTFFSSFGFATPVPVHAEPNNKFDISAEELIFDPVPWVSPGPGNTASIVPYTVEDYTPTLAGTVKQNLLGFATLANGGFTFFEVGLASGDLAVKYINNSGADRLFVETVLTIYFERGAIDIFLPEFDLAVREEIHFWAADDGSTYYANVTGIPGSATGLNMEAKDSIAAGHIARVPEPSTIAILGLGGLFLRRRKPVQSENTE
ncbi:MAG: PEP-CTERM sorting domain-containing protein [Planctomycetes bacterium]|nr:PEP-CTERM sorting domain-containing protein [Planctomycetota bacterium]